MIRLSLIFFVVFSSNIFCVRIRLLQGFFAGKCIMLFYSPDWSKYQQASNVKNSALTDLKTKYKGNVNSVEYKNEEKKIENAFDRAVYSFDFPSTDDIRVRELLNYFLRVYNEGKTVSGKTWLAVSPGSVIDINNYEFKNLFVMLGTDSRKRIDYKNIEDVVDVEDDCIISIKFTQKPSSPSGKKSSGGCSCKKGKN